MTVANVHISNMSFDLPAISEAAGNGDVDARRVSEDRLYVTGVTQEALEAALVAYDHDVFLVQKATRKLRAKRDNLLSESDWTQLADVSLDNKDAWQTYRQTLRDLPANTEDPKNPEWPTEPS